MQWCRWYLFVILCQLQWPIARSRVNFTLDLAFLFTVQYEDADITPFKECVRALPENFIVSRSLTRIAIVARDGGYDKWKVFTMTSKSLMDNPWDVEGALRQIRPIEWLKTPNWDTSLGVVRTKVFPGPTVGRTMVLVVICAYETHHLIDGWPMTLGERLRKDGVVIHAISMPDEFTENALSRLTGDPNKVDVRETLGMKDMKAAFSRLQVDVIAYACELKRACFYTDQNMNCASNVWAPGVPTDVFDCDAHFHRSTPSAGESCPKENCSQTCNTFWPLGKEQFSCTNETCGWKLSIPRTGPMRWRELEHCPLYKLCPACPSSARPSSVRPTAAHSTASGPVATTTAPSSDFPIWSIALAVVLVILVVGGVIIGVVLMKKKDSRKSTGKGKSAKMKVSRKEVSTCPAHMKTRSVATASVSMKVTGKKRKK